MDWKLVTEVSSACASVVVILSVPFGVYEYYRNSRRERQEREHLIYDSAEKAYMDFLTLCFENPELDLFDIPDQRSPCPSPEDQKRELIAFTMLVTVFERAFVLHRTLRSPSVMGRWLGWEAYIADYSKRHNFRKAWQQIGDQFDTQFQQYMHRIMEQMGHDGLLQEKPSLQETPYADGIVRR